VPDPDGLYVYALVPSSRAGGFGTGIDGAPLLAVEVGDVAAVVHEHRGGPSGGDDETLRRRVLEHTEVVERLWAADHALLPMTFDVIVAGSADATARDRLETWLGSIEDAARDGLERIGGRVELRVDLALDLHQAAAADAEVQILQARIGAASTGVARLLRKRLDLLEREVTEALADRRYPDLRSRLAGASAEISENPRAVAEGGEVLVLSAALLVDEDAVDRVGHVLAGMRDEEPALRVRFLGPWPPYSFVALRPAAVGSPG